MFFLKFTGHASLKLQDFLLNNIIKTLYCALVRPILSAIQCYRLSCSLIFYKL